MRVLAAPAVRKLALELRIDLTQVAGSGPAGRVLPSDVRKGAEQPQPPVPPQENGEGAKKLQHQRYYPLLRPLNHDRVKKSSRRKRCTGCAGASPSGWSKPGGFPM
ncbi:MAG: hypothetical protein HC875_11955 [Anaerolineales bacterium]|nr:hypothetical protein [Anaerolineales bacterium]